MHDKEIFNRFLQLMSQQQTKRQKVTYYADQLNITSKYLSVISKRVSGKSPMRWITESVMEDSYMLLTKTDLSIKEISNRLGFPNPSFFGHYFSEQSGVTPVDYRNKYKKVL
jgi:AraC-like DNA-binding protein